MSIQSIPLNKLTASANNVRKTGGGNVSELAASIHAHGLIQNLTVVKTGSGFDVIAGGRRLRAMQQLVKEKKLPSDQSIPCLVVDHTAAAEASLAENTIREAMHPADQFDAFRSMVEAGRSITEVAARFGVAESVVKQRLKLANVSPKILAEYRAGTATLEQMQALSISDSHKDQENAWVGAAAHEKTPRELIRKLTAKEISSDDARVKFIGLQAYEAAGGPVRKDLFSTKAYIADVDLLETMVTEKLKQTHDQVLAEGWLWVEVNPKITHSERWQYQDAGKPTKRKHTAEEQTKIDELTAKHDALEDLIYGDDAPEDTSEQEELHSEIGRQLDRLDEAAFEWPAKLKAKSGVLIYLGEYGINIDRGLLKPGEKQGSKNSPVSRDASGQPESKSPAQLSAAQVQRLYGERTAILRNEIGAHEALAAMASSLADRLLSLHGEGTPVNVAPCSSYETPDFKAGIESNPANKALESSEKTWLKALEQAKGDVFGWLLKQPEQTTIDLLAFLAASAISAQDEGKEFAEAAGVNIADHWQVTEDWLSKQTTAYITAAATEAAGSEQTAALANCKGKAALVSAAFALITAPTSKHWLPEPLRGPIPTNAGKAKTRKGAKK